MMKPQIAVLGAGRMGSALAKAFLRQGYCVRVWNRTPSKTEPLAALGARIAPAVLDAAGAADVIVVNVIDYAASDHLLRPAAVATALRGKLLVQLTSGSPRQAREMAAWARQHAIRYLDGAIMAPPNFIGEPGCTILYAGVSELFAEYKPVLLALGGDARFVGSDAGHATALDNALLAVVWGAMFGALQGVSIGQAEQLPLAAYLSTLHAIMPAVDASLADIVERVQTEHFAGETSLGTVDLHHGGVRRLIEVCQQHGIHAAVPAAYNQLFHLAAQAGQGQADFAVLTQFMREGRHAPTPADTEQGDSHGNPENKAVAQAA